MCCQFLLIWNHPTLLCNCYTKHFFFKDFFFPRGQTLLVYICVDEQWCDWLIFHFYTYSRCVQTAGLMFSHAAATPLSITRAAADWCGVFSCSNYRNGRDINASDRAWYWTHKQSPPTFQLLPTLGVPKKQPPPPRKPVSIFLSLCLSHPISTICSYINLCYIWKMHPYIQKLRAVSSCFHKTSIYLMLPEVFRTT